MNIEKFTENSQNAIFESQNIAISNGNQVLEVVHLHLALLKQNNGLVPKLLKNMGVELEEIIKDLETAVDKLPKVIGDGDSLYASRRYNQILSTAEKISASYKDEFVSVEHIYQAILDERHSSVIEIFKKYGITKESFLESLSKVRGNQRVTSSNPEDNYDALNKYGQDLVELARFFREERRIIQF